MTIYLLSYLAFNTSVFEARFKSIYSHVMRWMVSPSSEYSESQTKGGTTCIRINETDLPKKHGVGVVFTADNGFEFIDKLAFS